MKISKTTVTAYDRERDDTSWAGGSSEHAGKSRGIQDERVHPTSIICVSRVSAQTSQKAISATLLMCTVGSVSHPSNKGDASSFHTVTATVCYVSSATHKKVLLVLSYFPTHSCPCLHLHLMILIGLTLSLTLYAGAVINL